MKVEELEVGPILGEVSNSSVKVFGRGRVVMHGGKPRRCHLVIRLKESSKVNWSSPKYFKLNPNFDMSSVAVWEGLRDSNEYDYQCGYIFSEVSTSDIDVASILDWGGIEIQRVVTGAGSGNKGRTVVVGSCRYLLRLFGGNWLDDRGDKTFRSIYKTHIESPIDSLIMAGDQIYADDLNVLSPDSTIDEYLTRYRLAFSQPHIRKLMATVPTLMTLDDHEIEDNWPESASSKDMVTKFPVAMHAYQIYQASHSPLFPIVNGKISSHLDKLWYSHQDGCCDYFFLDTRTERHLEEPRQIISNEQMKAVKKWLMDGSGSVKVLVSSVPLWESTSKDKWNGFVVQRDELFATILENRIQRVVFLSGDVHASMASQLELSEEVKVLSIVSSAFYWPYPHPKPKRFKLSGSIETNSGNSYVVVNSSKVFSSDSYTKLKITPSQVELEVLDRKGKLRRTKTYQL